MFSGMHRLSPPGQPSVSRPATIRASALRHKTMKFLLPHRPLVEETTAQTALALLAGILLCFAPTIAHAQSVTFAGTNSVNFGAMNICPEGQTTPAPCSAAMTLKFNVTASGTLGTPQALTMGAPNLDFTLASGSTCTGSVTAGNDCTVNVNFAPRFAGGRKGGVQVVDASGNVLADVPVYGIGNGPQITFQPGSLSILSGFVGAGANTSLAVDGSGNVFVSDGSLYEIMAEGGYTTVKTLSIDVSKPIGLAVDGSGNLFVAAYDNNQMEQIVQKIPAAGGYTTISPVAAIQAWGLAVDGSRNLFVAEAYNDPLVELFYTGGGYPTGRLLTGPYSWATGVAVDGSGNLFVTDAGGKRVQELFAAESYNTGITMPGGQGIEALGIAVDASGNVFLADEGDGAVLEILAEGGYTTVRTLASGYPHVTGVAVDASGNVYFAAGADNAMRIWKLDYADPPSVVFPTPTPVGAVDGVDGPQAVTVWNSGNQPLTGGGTLSNDFDFTVIYGPDTVPDCNGVLLLDPGMQCNIRFVFTPHSGGPLTATFALSDNSLNGNPSTQAIQMSGTGIGPIIPQIGGISPNYGAPAAFVTITGSNFGATQGNGYVVVGNGRAQVTSWSAGSITIRVPSTATTGNLYLSAGGHNSNAVPFTVNREPSLSSISTTSGPAGTPVTFTGANLTGTATVTFNGAAAAILSNTGTQIQVNVPPDATSGLVLVVVNGIALIPTRSFLVPPQITSVSPNYGAPAATITITGTTFGATQGYGLVIVGGVRPDVTAWSDTSITFRVPSSATTGNIVVETDRQTSNSVAFTIYNEPSITGLSVNSGPIGTSVTITGNNLLDGENNATASFSGIPAPISSDTSGSIQVTVPAGATTGRLLVKVNGVAMIATTNFIVTP